jgi:hypothetical protein
MDIRTNGPGISEHFNTSVGERQKRPSGLPASGLEVESKTFRIRIRTSDHYLVCTQRVRLVLSGDSRQSFLTIVCDR